MNNVGKWLKNCTDWDEHDAGTQSSPAIDMLDYQSPKMVPGGWLGPSWFTCLLSRVGNR